MGHSVWADTTTQAAGLISQAGRCQHQHLGNAGYEAHNTLQEQPTQPLRVAYTPLAWPCRTCCTACGFAPGFNRKPSVWLGRECPERHQPQHTLHLNQQAEVTPQLMGNHQCGSAQCLAQNKARGCILSIEQSCRGTTAGVGGNGNRFCWPSGNGRWHAYSKAKPIEP